MSKFTLNISRGSQGSLSEVEFLSQHYRLRGSMETWLLEKMSYNYEVDNTNSKVNALSESESLDDIFVVQISDGNGGTVDQTVEFSIDGTDDPADISGDTSVSGSEDTTSPAHSPLPM